MTAPQPFRFCARLALTFAAGRSARTLRQLADGLAAAPDAVVYHHTHHFLRQNQTVTPEPPNDFAWWVTNVLQDELLGERLAAVDTVSFPSLGALRAALIAAMEPSLAGSLAAKEAPEGRAFHFLSAKRFSLPTAHSARDLGGFAAELKKVSLDSLYLHVFEARLRPPLLVNDFSHWLKEELGEAALADKLREMDPYTQTLEGLRARILDLVERRLADGGT